MLTGVPGSSGTAGWASSPRPASRCGPRRRKRGLPMPVPTSNVQQCLPHVRRDSDNDMALSVRNLSTASAMGYVPPPAPPPVGGKPIRVPVQDLKYTCGPASQTVNLRTPHALEVGGVGAILPRVPSKAVPAGPGGRTVDVDPACVMVSAMIDRPHAEH